jgi:F-type H+-transporting ATPase subunit gamma
MKMVAGARLQRAQQRILALRPYAVSVGEVLASVTLLEARRAAEFGPPADELAHPLLARRPEQSALFIVITSDRGLCGAFNANIVRTAERLRRAREQSGQRAQLAIIGRKGRDFFQRRKASIHHVFQDAWQELSIERTRPIARTVLRPFIQAEVDAIYLVYNEFKSAMSQRVVAEPLFPLPLPDSDARPREAREHDYLFEPNKRALLERLVPMYVEVSILRALLESMASELGARMTAMDAATKNASDMISRLTLQYNRARQAAITTELMEIIGGAEALRG